MKKRNLQNENFGLLGRRVLDAAKVGNDEIEKIIASPKLYDGVKARIESERRVYEAKNFPRGSWTDFPFWNWQKIKVFAAVLLFLTGAAGGIGFINFNEIKIEQTDVQPITAPAKYLEIPALEPVKSLPETAQTAANKNKSNQPFTRAISVNKIRKTEKSFAKIEPRRKFENKPKPVPLEFYALNGNPVEPGEEIRIVRTELSRTALFALGVNLSIENETEKLKTDLLVGSDGVARAIRIVY